MSGTNSKIALLAAEQVCPITFDAAESSTDIQELMDLVAAEELNATTHRLFLDEMSPAARISLYSILTAMKANAVVIETP